MGQVIYWAGPLFTQAERIWNRMCAESLRAFGYTVILPQDEAEAFITDNVVDALGIAEHCYQQATHCDVVVAILDGADSDSGTSVEVGLVVGHRRGSGRGAYVVAVRTDFRASEDGQLNAMFRLVDEVIYFPSLSEDTAMLCDGIHKCILRRLGSTAAQ